MNKRNEDIIKNIQKELKRISNSRISKEDIKTVLKGYINNNYADAFKTIAYNKKPGSYCSLLEIINEKKELIEKNYIIE